MKTCYEERLNILSEIAADCFDVNGLEAEAASAETRVDVRVADLVRALESAYDVGLVAGYRLVRSQVAH
jgi:hypothetical protein